MANVIDSLIVELGLDPSKFRKGTAEAERQTKHTQEAFKKSGEAMTKSLVDVARNVFVAFVGFESVSGLVNFLGKLNQVQASLGRMAANFGVSARALDVWDKKIELAGGTVAGAQTAINQLNQDIIGLQTQGQVSPLLVFMQRLGIAIMDSAGHMRDAKSTYTDMFAALAKLPRSTAFQLATAAGVSPDLLSYGLRPQAERAAIDAEAARLSRTTDASTRAADQLRERWVTIKDSLEAIGIELLEKITPALERMLPVIEKLELRFANWLGGLKADDATREIDKLSASVESLNYKLQVLADYWRATGLAFEQTGEQLSDPLSRITHPFDSAENPTSPLTSQGRSGIWDAIANWFRSFGKFSAAPYGDAFRSATRQFNLPPGLLEAIADRESGFDPNAVGKAGELGVMQLLPRYHPNAGKDPAADILEAARTLAELYQQFGNWTTATMAYNAGGTRIGKALAGTSTVPSTTQRYVADVAAGMRGARSARTGQSVVNNNTTTVGPITIVTNATDGKQVGVDFMAEMKKRNLVLQADTGIVP